MKFRHPKGTKDILPKDIFKWHYVENIIREVTNLYNFKEIRTPTFESTDLFTRGVGTETDIVGKEMYTFDDKGGNSLTLRPEMTAPVIRAFIENSLFTDNVINKLYYISSIFRYEKPQEGRFREHTQFGAELIGTDDILSDIELINMAKTVYNKSGITSFKLKINSIGKIEERKRYVLKLKEYLQKFEKDLSEDSKRRLSVNTLRVLDSKTENDRKITDDAPKILDNLDSLSRTRFDKVLEGLSDLDIEYEIDFRLVRGLDYYTDTTFEFVSDKLGAQDAIGGGGRYDNLTEILGGKSIPGIGFGVGLERLIMVAEKCNMNFSKPEDPFVYIIALNEDAQNLKRKLVFELRKNNIKCEADYLSKSFKAQMRDADKLKSQYVYIIGDDELREGSGILKNMTDSSQTKIKFDNIINNLLDENKKGKTTTKEIRI